MSTRCTTHFIDSTCSDSGAAIIYRHSDGYPEGAGLDLRAFLTECKALKDSRLSDVSYLAAKYVVFLADIFNQHGAIVDGQWKEIRNASKLDFLSVGIMSEDPGDIEYRYVVDCGKLGKDGLPTLTCLSVPEGKVCTIPKVKAVKRGSTK